MISLARACRAIWLLLTCCVWPVMLCCWARFALISNLCKWLKLLVNWSLTEATLQYERTSGRHVRLHKLTHLPTLFSLRVATTADPAIWTFKQPTFFKRGALSDTSELARVREVDWSWSSEGLYGVTICLGSWWYCIDMTEVCIKKLHDVKVLEISFLTMGRCDGLLPFWNCTYFGSDWILYVSAKVCSPSDMQWICHSPSAVHCYPFKNSPLYVARISVNTNPSFYKPYPLTWNTYICM